MKTEKYFCPECFRPVELSAKPKRTFMGFLRIPCPICKKEFRYPITVGYVIIYWILLIGSIGKGMEAISQGKAVPNPIAILIIIFVIISLIKNSLLKKQISKMQNIINK
jgi:hypothetical protein